MMGRYVLDTFFDGDVEAFERGHRSHPAFSRIADHPRLLVGAQRLYRATRVAAQVAQLPHEVARSLSYSHHLALLGVRDPELKLVLARQAVEERYTRDRLAQVAASLWRSHGARARCQHHSGASSR